MHATSTTTTNQRTTPAGAVIVVLFLLATLGTPAAATKTAPPRVSREVPVTATNLAAAVANNSPALAVDPTEARFVVLAHRLDGPDFGCALQGSGDGGRGWIPLRPVPRLPKGADKCYAPEVAFDADGTLYYLFVGLAGGGNRPMGAFVVTSTDRGMTFSAPRRVLGGGRYMVRMAIDPTLGKRGRLHLVWLETKGDVAAGGLPPTSNPILTSYSDDGGRTFSRPRRVSDPDRARVVAPALALGPDHAVHVVYYDLGADARDYQGLEGPVWEGTWSLVVTSSRDGGRSFGPGVVVDDAVVPPERVMLIYTMPPPSLVADDKGALYAAWHDGRNGDWDVFVRRSGNARRWGPARRVNDDRRTNQRHQYLPRLSVAPDGRLDVVFYDRRGNVENRGNDVYYAWSSDGGRSFARNVRVTTVDFDSTVGYEYSVASAAGQVEFGSRLALVSERGRALAAWTDTRHTARTARAQDIFAAEIAHRRSR